jgi:exonuclease III
MRLVVWNSRGVGNGPTVRGILDLRDKEDPDVFFLSETKAVREKLEWLRWKLGMPNMIVKDCSGQSGGLAMFWKNEVNVRQIGFASKYHLAWRLQRRMGSCGDLQAFMGSRR